MLTFTPANAVYKPPHGSPQNEDKCSNQAEGCSCSKTLENIFEDDAARKSAGRLSQEQKRESRFLAANFGLFVLAVLGDEYFSALLGPWGTRGLFILPYLICALPVLKSALRSARKGDLANEFMLMSVATLAAIGLGHMAEAVGVMLFYRIGEFFQDLASSRSRSSISALLASKPSTANLLADGEVSTVQVETVEPGATIIVRVGEKIPLDGVVTAGVSQVDQSPLTGESVPVRINAGDAVLAGSINLGAVLTVLVKNRFADTHMARIMEMVENAVQRKSPTERFISRFARYYTPAVILAAVLVAVIPPLAMGGAWSVWVYRALVLLVISCPCALLISVPLGYFGGIGAASRHGILVKGGNVLDGVLKTRAVVFDKTGTLTEGVFEVTGIVPAPQENQSDAESVRALLEAAAIAECESNHPIARAVTRAAAAKLPAAARPADLDAQEVPGKGMRASSDGVLYLAGRAALLKEHGISGLEADVPGTVVHLAADSRYLGYIVVSDRIRPEAPAAIRELKAAGLGAYMLTGDKEESAAWVAGELGLDGYRAGLLPEDKVQGLAELGDPASLAFVGDGINDTPSIATAGVGIAMGGMGAEAAIETADAVILNDNPESIPMLYHIARNVRRVVWQNIILALGVKTSFMALGAIGVSGLWEAVFADVGVALLAVLNSARGTRG